MRDSVEFSSPGSRESTELLQKLLHSVLEVLLSPGTGNTDSRCHCGSSSHRALRLCTQTVPSSLSVKYEKIENISTFQLSKLSVSALPHVQSWWFFC